MPASDQIDFVPDAPSVAAPDIDFQPDAPPEGIQWSNLSLKGVVPAALQAGQKGIGETAMGVSTLMDAMPPVSMDLPPTDYELEIYRKRLARTPQQQRTDIERNPIFVGGKALSDVAAETHPIPESARRGVLTKAAESAGSFVPAVMSGPLAPFQIGAQMIGQHMDADFDSAKAQGLTDDQAAEKAYNQALASGATAAAIFAALPAPLRKASDKWIVDKFLPELGNNVVTRYLRNRVAQVPEMATLMGAAAGGEAVVSGQPVIPAVASGAAGGALLGVFTPRGISEKQAGRLAKEQAERIAEEQAIVQGPPAQDPISRLERAYYGQQPPNELRLPSAPVVPTEPPKYTGPVRIVQPPPESWAAAAQPTITPTAGVPNAETKVTETGSIPAQQGVPTIGVPEGKVEVGTALGQGPGEKGPQPGQPEVAPSDKIVAAAYQLPDGKVFTGVTHMEADMDAQDAGAKVDDSMAGFVTQSGKFLNREQAYQHSIATGAIDRESDTFAPGKMHSGKFPGGAATPTVEPPPTLPAATPAPKPEISPTEQPVVPSQGRDWNLFAENLNDELDSFAPARDTGRIDYDLTDAAQRFVEYAKADTSGKPLDKLVGDFAKTDDASASQIRKIRQSVKSILEKEKAQAPVPPAATSDLAEAKPKEPPPPAPPIGTPVGEPGRETGSVETKWKGLTLVQIKKKLPIAFDEESARIENGRVIARSKRDGREWFVDVKKGEAEPVSITAPPPSDVPPEQSAKQEPKAAVGDRITFTPTNKRNTPVSGEVTEIIHNTEGQVGYHVLSPLPGDPGRIIRVWDRDGTIAKSETPKSDVESLLSVPVPDVSEQRQRVSAIDRRQAELREEHRKVDSQIKEIEKVIKPQRGNPYTRSKIKASAKKSDVAKYRDLEKQRAALDNELRALDDAAKSDRQAIDKAQDAAVISDKRAPLIRRLDRAFRAGESTNPALAKALSDETYRLLREKYPDITDEEMVRLAPEVQRAAYFATSVDQIWKDPNLPNPSYLRRAALDAAVNAPDVPKHLFPPELKAKLDRFRSGDRVYGGKPAPGDPVEDLSAKQLEDLKTEIRTTSQKIQEDLKAKEEADAKEKAEAEAKEQQLIIEAQAVADSAGKTGTKGGRSAKEVKADLVSRISAAIDEVVSKDKTEIKVGEEGDVTATSESGGAFGTIEPASGGFKVTARNPASPEKALTVTVKTREEAQWVVKAMASRAIGKAVIGVPGDGVFRLERSGPHLLGVWSDARKLEVSGGTQKAYKASGGAETPPSDIKTVRQWQEAKEYHGLEATDKIHDWSRALLELAKKVNPEHPEEVTTASVDKYIEDKRKQPPEPPTTREARVPTFYSRIVRAVEQSSQNKASGSQWKAMVRNKGVSADEWSLVKVDDLEDGKSYTKQEVLDYLRANEVQVRDVTLRSDLKPEKRWTENRYARPLGEGVTWTHERRPIYNVPGLEQGEVIDQWTGFEAQPLFGRQPEDATIQHIRNRGFVVSGAGLQNAAFDTLADAQRAAERGEMQATPAMADQTYFSQYTLPGAKEGSYREVLLTVPDEYKLARGRGIEWGKYGQTWKDGHSQYDNILNPIVRLRFNERTTADGKRMLFLEEIQPPQKGEFEKMPALFQKQWREIAFKWALRHGAENGFDEIGWTTGEHQAERYDLSKHVDSIIVGKSATDKGYYIQGRKGGTVVIGKNELAREQIGDYIGKDIAAKALERLDALEKEPGGKEYEGTTLSGVDLKIGGEGLKKLYDQDFPAVVNKLDVVRKAGQKVGTSEIRTGEERADYLVVERPNEPADSRWQVQMTGRTEYFRTLGEARAFAKTLQASTIHSIPITPEMRRSVVEEGQRLAMLRQGHPETPLSESAVTDHLRTQYGLTTEGIIRIVNDPNSPRQAQVTVAPDGKLRSIEINPANIGSREQLDAAIQHELAHVPEIRGEIDRLLPQVTPDELAQARAEVAARGYSDEVVPSEVNARAVQALTDAWKGRNWFEKAVGTVQRLAAQLGFKMSRLAAESTAARAIANALKEAQGMEPGRLTPDQQAMLAQLGGKTVTREARMPTTPKELEDVVALRTAAGPIPTAAATGELVRLKTKIADDLNLSPRARHLFVLDKAEQLFNKAIELGSTIFNYRDAREWSKDKSPGEKWAIIQNAWQSLGTVEHNMVELAERLAEQTKKLESRGFQRKREWLAKREGRMIDTQKAEERFRTIAAAKIGYLEEQLRSAAGDEARISELRQQIAAIKGTAERAAAVVQKMRQMVGKVYEWNTGQFNDYWNSQMRRVKTGEEFANLYFKAMSDAGTPVKGEQRLLAQLAAETFAINRTLGRQLYWETLYQHEPDFKSAFDTFSKAFLDRLETDPKAAMAQLLGREQRLAIKAERARRAYADLNAEIMADVQEYNDLADAHQANEALKNSAEWRELVNLVNSDTGALHIPAIVADEARQGKFLDLSGKVSKRDPSGKLWEIDLEYTPDKAAAAQETVQQYLSTLDDWLFDPKNRSEDNPAARHPDFDFWQRERDLIDAVYNTHRVMSPTAVKSFGFGFQFIRRPWAMPEFLFRQLKLPVGKILQTAAENWRRAWDVGTQWAMGAKEPIVAAAYRAMRSHKIGQWAGTQGYRDQLLNALGWYYRNNRKVYVGMMINGRRVTAQDIAYVKTVGKAVNEIHRRRKNIGAEQVMPEPLILDEWGEKQFGYRTGHEFGSEPFTTMPRDFSKRGEDFAADLAKLKTTGEARRQEIMATMDKPAYAEFPMYWLDQRAFPYTKVTSYENVLGEIYELMNQGDPRFKPSFDPDTETYKSSFEKIVDYIDEHTPEEITREQILRDTIDDIDRKVMLYWNKFVKPRRDAAQKGANVRVIEATTEGPFTTGFKEDIGSAFFYDYGLMSRSEVLSHAIDSTVFHMRRFDQALDSTEKVYYDALEGYRNAARVGKTALKQYLAKHRGLFRTGDDFRDFEDLEMHMGEIRKYKEDLYIWKSQMVNRIEGLSTMYRLLRENVLLTLHGFGTSAKVLLDSVAKEGMTLQAWYPIAIMSHPTAWVSSAMSVFNFTVRAPAIIAGRRLGLLKTPELYSGLAEEWFRTSKYYNQMDAFGLGIKTPWLDEFLNSWRMPVTHGGSYNAKLSDNPIVSKIQLAAFYGLTAGETVSQQLSHFFPNAFYPIAYDSVARQMHWRVNALERRLRKTFDTYERMGKLDRFDLDNFKSVKNKLLPNEILPDLWPTTQTKVDLVRQWFDRGIDLSLDDAILGFFAKLSKTAPEARRDVHLLSWDAKTPTEAVQLQWNRAGQLASLGVIDVHHNNPLNRPWTWRKHPMLQFINPVMGWPAQSTRQFLALLGKSSGDPRFGNAALGALTMIGALGTLAMLGISGEIRKRVFEKLNWLLYKKVVPEKHFGQGQGVKQNVEIVASDIFGYVSLMEAMTESIFGERSGRMDANNSIYALNRINTMMDYVGSVVTTGSLTSGLPTMAKKLWPISPAILSRLPGTAGLTVENNVRTILQKYAPMELVREGGRGYGAPVATELTPIKQAMANAIYSGDNQAFQKAYQNFVDTDVKLGRSPEDAERHAKAIVRSLHPYSIGLIAHPTEAQRQEILSKVPEGMRGILLGAEQHYAMAADSIGIGTAMAKAEPGAGMAASGDIVPRRTSAGTGTLSLGVGSGRAAGIPGVSRVSLVGGGYRRGGLRRRVGLGVGRGFRSRARRLVSGKVRVSSGRLPRAYRTKRRKVRRYA